MKPFHCDVFLKHHKIVCFQHISNNDDDVDDDVVVVDDDDNDDDDDDDGNFMPITSSTGIINNFENLDIGITAADVSIIIIRRLL